VITHPKPGFGYFYYAGSRVTDEIELSKFPLYDHFDAWIEAHGREGKSWFEEVMIPTQKFWSGVLTRFSSRVVKRWPG
jgi:hypothetical protein